MSKEFEGKKLLILGANKLICDIVIHAKEMGAYVICADYYEDSPAKKIADEGVLIDATDVDALVRYCQENNVDGVTTGFVDILMPICYEVCKKLNLSYYATPKMIAMATNKIEFKEICEKYGVPVPKTYLISSSIPKELYSQIKYPVFVKPLDVSGSRGAGVCYNSKELDDQFADAISYSVSNQAIIEDYIVGREFLMDYIAVDGEYRMLSMIDRYVCEDRASAINFANVSLAPSKGIDYYFANLNDKVVDMFKSLGFNDGLIFLQGHFNGNEIIFYEMGCRLGGSFFELEQACLGFNPVDMIVRYALSGKMTNAINEMHVQQAKYNKFALGYNFLLKGDSETIAEITGIDTMVTLQSYLSSIQYMNVGDHFKKDRTMDKPLVSIYMVCDSLEQVRKDITFLNKSFEARNESGQSLLMKKFNPAEL